VSVDRLVKWIGRSAPRIPADDSADAAALAAWTDRIMRRMPPPWRRTCLKRALVVYYLLHRAGMPAGLRIGVRYGESRELVAHAWLVRGDEPFLEWGPERTSEYQVLATLPKADEVPR
jgi:hypothetical protein